MSDLTDELHDEVVRDCGCPVDREHVCNDLRAAVEALTAGDISDLGGLASQYAAVYKMHAIYNAARVHRCTPDEAALAARFIRSVDAFSKQVRQDIEEAERGLGHSLDIEGIENIVAENARQYARLRGEK